MSLTKSFWLDWRVYESGLLHESIIKQLYHWQLQDVENALLAGHVLINGVNANNSQYVLHDNDLVRVYLPEHCELSFSDQWHIVWERQDLMVVHKPAILPVSRTTQNLFGTLISLVRRHTPSNDAHLLHRLDAETSGLIVLTKYTKADQRWKKRLDQLIEKKIYHALVHGNPSWDEYLAEDWLAEKLDSPIRTQMHVVDEHDTNTLKIPKLARTQFKVLKRMQDVSLVECTLLTGRKHQIRAQLAHNGFPIIGDKIYSHNGEYYLKRLQQDLTSDDFRMLGASHHLLHAYALVLNTKREVIQLVDEDYPTEMADIIAGL